MCSVMVEAAGLAELFPANISNQAQRHLQYLAAVKNSRHDKVCCIRPAVWVHPSFPNPDDFHCCKLHNEGKFPGFIYCCLLPILPTAGGIMVIMMIMAAVVCQPELEVKSCRDVSRARIFSRGDNVTYCEMKGWFKGCQVDFSTCSHREVAKEPQRSSCDYTLRCDWWHRKTVIKMDLIACEGKKIAGWSLEV